MENESCLLKNYFDVLLRFLMGLEYYDLRAY